LNETENIACLSSKLFCLLTARGHREGIVKVVHDEFTQYAGKQQISIIIWLRIFYSRIEYFA